MPTTPSALERALRRLFGDPEPTAFGSGWMSGTGGVFLGSLAVAGTLAFRYPELFTTAAVRDRYPIALLRAVLEIFILGFATTALYAYLVVVSFHAVFIHANVRWRFGWLDRVVATPRGHHWHHARSPIDTNFAVHLPALDWIFGYPVSARRRVA